MKVYDKDGKLQIANPNKLDKATNVTAINDAGIADGEIVVFNLTGKDIRTSDKTIVTTLGTDDTTVPTSKAVKDVTDLKSPTASPTFTGTPASVTAAAGIDTTQIATTAFVQSESGIRFERMLTGSLYPTTFIPYVVTCSSTITTAMASTSTLPGGANILIQAYKNVSGVVAIATDSIFLADTPITITTSNTLTNKRYIAYGTLDTARTPCYSGDVITVAITQVGTTNAGQDLQVLVMS